MIDWILHCHDDNLVLSTYIDDLSHCCSVLCDLQLVKPLNKCIYKDVRNISNIDFESSKLVLPIAFLNPHLLKSCLFAMTCTVDKHASCVKRRMCDCSSTPWCSAIDPQEMEAKCLRRKAERKMA